MTKNSLGDLDASSNPVCWNGSMTCGTKASDNTQFGWIISLPGSNGGVAGSTLYNEQVVYNPVFYQGAFVVNTIIPANNDPASCTTSADTGNTIAVSVATGGAIPHFFTNYGDAMAAGFQTNGSGSPFVLMAGSDTYLITQTTTGENSDGSATQGPGPFYCGDGLCSTSIKPPGATGRRLTWIEKR
jgi:type IV pilus assembly protein PilY1